MYKIAKPLFLMTETSLHAGSGDNLGVVDLPIQRERITGFPKIESSSLKGGLRESLEVKIGTDLSSVNTNCAKIHRVFGYDEGGLPDNKEKQLRELFIDVQQAPARDFAGCLGFTDARLLLFPVKSARGVFAWTTCPLVLQRLYDDLHRSGMEEESLGFLKKLSGQKEGLCMADANLPIGGAEGKKCTILLEEYGFELEAERKGGEHTPLHDFANWLSSSLLECESFWKEKMKKDIVILSNEDFTDFVQLSTEVITRIKINNKTGTVEQGGLFTEEYLPSECLLYTIVQAAPELNRVAGREETNGMPAEEVLRFFGENLNGVVQLGGNASLGKGLLQTFKKFLNDE